MRLQTLPENFDPRLGSGLSQVERQKVFPKKEFLRLRLDLKMRLGINYLIGQIFVGQNYRNFGLVSKILSDEKCCDQNNNYIK